MRRAITMVLLLTLFAGMRTAWAEPVSASERAALQTAIQQLYDAYARRDVDGVVALEHGYIEAKAADYAKSGKGTADEWRDAFIGGVRDVLTHKDFRMKSLHLDDLAFRRVGTFIEVTSAIPIIATEYVTLNPELTVRLTVSNLRFERTGAEYRIVRMND